MVTRFMLADCSHQIVDGRISSKPFSWKKFWREVEIFPLVRLHSRILGWLGYALFQPKRASDDFRGWLAQRRKRDHNYETKSEEN